MNSVHGNINYYAITLCRAMTEEDLEVRSTADDQEQQATEAKFNLQAEDACLSQGLRH